MKFFALIGFVIIAVFSKAQVTYFNKKFDLRGGGDESSSIVTVDSGYVVCANGYHANNGFLGVGLFFLDKNGDSLYTKWFGKDYHHYFDGWGGAFRKYSKGGFYLAGAIGDTSGTIHAALYLFTENGDTLWTKKYGNGIDFYAFYHARETADKGFILAGARDFGSNTQGLLIKTDSLGNVEWERNYGGSGVEYGTMVLPMANGQYLLGGETETLPCSAGATDQWLIRTNSAGTQQWQKCYGTVNDEGNALPGCEFTNGDFAFVGQWAYNSTSWYPYISRVNSSGNNLWTRKFRPHGGSDFLRNMLVTDSEDILAVGKISTPMGTRGLMIRASADGDSLWYRKYEYYSTYSVHELWDIDTAHGGGYVMCGTTNQSSVQDVWVIKVDSHGCLFDPDCWLPGAYEEDKYSVCINDLEKENYFSIYPNPNNGRFTLENKVGIKSDMEIKIYNPLGEILFSTMFINTKTEIDLTEFSNGIYFIEVIGDGIMWREKIVKE